MNDPVNDIVKFTLAHVGDLQADKITALAALAQSVSDYKLPTEKNPNEIKPDDEEPIPEGAVFPVDEVLGIQVDSGKVKKVHIQRDINQNKEA